MIITFLLSIIKKFAFDRETPKKSLAVLVENKVEQFPPIKNKRVQKLVKPMEKTTRELMVQVDFTKNMTTVFSQYSPTDNLTMQLDALCVTLSRCIEEGEDPEKLQKKVRFYLDTVVMSYSPNKKEKMN